MPVSHDDRRRDKAILRNFTLPAILCLVSLCLLGLQQYFPAAVCMALAIYLGSTRAMPGLFSRMATSFGHRSQHRQAALVSGMGIAWCRSLKIGGNPNLPRSIAWDSILMGQQSAALVQLGKLDESQAMDQELLKILEDAQDVVGIAKVTGRIAFIYTQQGKLVEASRLVERTVPRLEAAVANAIRNNDEKLLPVYRAELCSSLFEQGTLLETKRDFAAAEVVRRRAVDAAKEAFGLDALHAMPHLSMLGKLLTRLGHTDEAEPLLKKVVEVRAKHLPRQHVLMASANLGLGNIYSATDRLQLAAECLESALQTVTQLEGKNYIGLPEFKNALGRLRIKQGRYDEANELIVSAIEQKENQIAKMHPELVDFLEDLAKLKRATGKENEAKAAEMRIQEILAGIAA
jgi:tetratricopeptide (TPR) repeat protein